MMTADNDLDAFLTEAYQLRDELSDLDEVASTKRLTTIILGVLLAEKSTAIKFQVIRDPDLSLEIYIYIIYIYIYICTIERIMKTIFINNSERSSIMT